MGRRGCVQAPGQWVGRSPRRSTTRSQRPAKAQGWIPEPTRPWAGTPGPRLLLHGPQRPVAAPERSSGECPRSRHWAAYGDRWRAGRSGWGSRSWSGPRCTGGVGRSPLRNASVVAVGRRGPAAAAHRRGGDRQDPSSCRRSRELAHRPGLRRCGVLRAFPQDVELTAGLLLNLGHLVSRRDDPVVHGERTGPGCRAWSACSSPRRRPGSGDAHHQRRLLVLDAVARLFRPRRRRPGAAAPGGPALVRRAEPRRHHAPSPDGCGRGRCWWSGRAGSRSCRYARGRRGCCCNGSPRGSRSPGWTTEGAGADGDRAGTARCRIPPHSSTSGSERSGQQYPCTSRSS